MHLWMAPNKRTSFGSCRTSSGLTLCKETPQVPNKMLFLNWSPWPSMLQFGTPSLPQDLQERKKAKDVHRSLTFAAGIFKHLKEVYIPRLITPAENGRDLDPRVMDTYMVQCKAEAQEVTIARAIELKHNATLIAALAFETANFYQKADHTLNTLEPECSSKWRNYLQLKEHFYMAYAYCYHGQTLLTSDKCGESIKSLQEAEKCYSRAEALCKEYRQTKGPGSTAKPSEQLFTTLGGLIKNTLQKCERENGFIYFHKVPAEVPQLELKASYGLAEPISFEFPAVSEQCTPEVYTTFDLTKGAKAEKAKPKQEEEVKPMKEPDLKPQKDTGCVIS
ncbi:BRO1 domain-containing protein BROX-like isoform X2 [Oncorhynchus keta]|nr:BRO1 domain-containing protein BROX-like isoform X2 [Oncorhynchus keta]XP_052379726.1 BRO1 domain-containing protein BROX-like isoform X2 [Oncorhynchus keta]XP_052379727.1 BRO1 domain-containing protein BROX-like isoform X2 [Oncorhynchus keta]XP_052379728.1 BRO1 domain-containing protein BROX-like isoform X2 [Oncorhynchus keta]